MKRRTEIIPTLCNSWLSVLVVTRELLNICNNKVVEEADVAMAKAMNEEPKQW